MKSATHLVTLVIAAIVLTGAVGECALAGVPDQSPPSVLRGSSAPVAPEPVRPNVVVLNQLVYQPVYADSPDYGYPLFYGSAFQTRSFVPKFRSPPTTAAPAPVPNGWPLL